MIVDFGQKYVPLIASLSYRVLIFHNMPSSLWWRELFESRTSVKWDISILSDFSKDNSCIALSRL